MFYFLLLIISGLWACNQSGKNKIDRFPEGKNKKFVTVKGINVSDPNVEIQLFGSEPVFANPTNMDIDHKGRIWICEAYNYRNDVNNIPYKKSGDRILILEDTNGDGKADKHTIFYQGEDVNSALGIKVLGNKVLVSSSPNCLIFTDDNHDDIPDKKEILFKTKGGFQSDHGLHTTVFGSDGKLYFNFGNHGIGLLDANNKPVKDIYGNVIDQSRKPFQDGMIIRCDLEGKNFEVMAWNFRNPYEVTVDSYGRMWQSDNDDDGVRSNRINFILPHGNYGYKDEITGADWRVKRINLEDSLYSQHWHQNDPGVVPNLHQTYAGSPTGIFIYEGNLFPQWKGRIFLGDAGNNEINSFKVFSSGAGFRLEKENILNATDNDQWFRPSDITVAPDGSIFVADWYDGGTGGHFVGDLDRGRIYRIRPKGLDYRVPKYNWTQTADLIKALANPNQSVQYEAFSNLLKKGNEVLSDLSTAYYYSSSPIHKSRILGLILRIKPTFVAVAVKDANPEIRAAAIRFSNQKHLLPYLLKLTVDPSPEVKRTLATYCYNKAAKDVWLSLANNYSGSDRWFLEALGIGAEGRWDDYLPELLQGKAYQKSTPLLDIIWRSRANISSQLLQQIISQRSIYESLRYYRAFSFQNKKSSTSILINMLIKSYDLEQQKIIFGLLDPQEVNNNILFRKSYPLVLKKIKSDDDFLEIIGRYSGNGGNDRLLNIFYKSKNKTTYAKAADLVALKMGMGYIRQAFKTKPLDIGKTQTLIERIGLVDNYNVSKELISIFLNPNMPFELRKSAVLAMEGYMSDLKLWDLVQVGKITPELMPYAEAVFKKTLHVDLKNKYEARFLKTKSAITTAPISTKTDFLKQAGDVKKGEVLFRTYCATCHVVNRQGIDFGPGLSEIGKKLTKENLYTAITNPSQGINFGYEGKTLNLKDGTSIMGIVTSKTNSSYLIKYPATSEIVEIPVDNVKSVTEQHESLMPAIQLKTEEYRDLIYYLSTLKSQKN